MVFQDNSSIRQYHPPVLVPFQLDFSKIIGALDGEIIECDNNILYKIRSEHSVSTILFEDNLFNIKLLFNSARCDILLPQASLDKIFADIYQISTPQNLGNFEIALLLEEALLPSLLGLRKNDFDIEVLSVSKCDKIDVQNYYNIVQIEAIGQKDTFIHTLIIVADEDFVEVAQKIVKPKTLEPIALTFEGSLLVNGGNFTFEDIKSLEVGDVIIIPSEGFASPYLQFSRNLGFETAILENHQNQNIIQIKSKTIKNKSVKEAIMTENHIDAPSLENVLEVDLCLQIGTITLDFKTLETMSAGQTIKFDKPNNGMVDIVANGKKIGNGEIVNFKGNFGVKVARISSNG